MSGFLTGLVLRGAGARAARPPTPRPALPPEIGVSSAAADAGSAPFEDGSAPDDGVLQAARPISEPSATAHQHAEPPRPAAVQAGAPLAVLPPSFQAERHVDAPAPPARPSAGPVRPRIDRLPGDDLAGQPASPGELVDGGARADVDALPVARPITPAGHLVSAGPPAGPSTGSATPVPAQAVEAQALVPAQRPEPGRVVAPPDQSPPRPRIEVRIGRVEVRIVPPPQRAPHAPAPTRDSRPADNHALARRYLDRRWY